MNKNTIPVFFRWDSVQPDHRQWKPSNPLLEPLEVMIAVDVPLEKEYVYNVDKLIISQISNDNTPIPLPILTPTGMRYCIDQLEIVMSDAVEKKTEINPDIEDDWEDVK